MWNASKDEEKGRLSESSLTFFETGALLVSAVAHPR